MKLCNFDTQSKSLITLDSSKKIDYQPVIATQHERGSMLTEVRFAEQNQRSMAVTYPRSAKYRRHASTMVPQTAIERKAHEVSHSLLKRVLDVVGAFFGLLLLSPVLLLVVVAIRLDSPGPALFRQWRYGANKVPFEILKFRSMAVMETSGAFVQARRNDPRVTRVGAFLRKSSLDELPQLWNILRGEMSLVGPRPHAIAMDETYAQQLPHYADRHLVKPGLTGLAQIEGCRGPTDTDDAILTRVAFDRIYIRSWSLARDIRILALTPIRLFRGQAF